MCAEDGEIVFPAVGVRTATEQIGFAQLYPRLQGLVADTCTIPGLETDYVPQGISWAETGELLLSYYDKMARHASILVAIDWDAKRVVGMFSLYASDGSPYRGHVGGLAAGRKSLWTGSDGRLLRFVIPAGGLRGTGTIKAVETYELDSSVSYLSLAGDTLWAGEFSHRWAGYSTAAHHRAKSKRAWSAGYAIDPATERLKSTAVYHVGNRLVLKPDRVIFTREKVQGMCFCGDILALSVSYSAADSKLALYRTPLGDPPFVVQLPEGARTDGFVVETRNHLVTVPMPAGSEGICWNGKRIAVVFEGGSKHYRSRWRRWGAMIEDRILLLDLKQLSVR